MVPRQRAVWVSGGMLSLTRGGAGGSNAGLVRADGTRYPSVVEQRTLEPKDERGPWRWVVIGCGALFLGGLCLVPAVATWLFFERDAVDEDAPPPVVSPAPTPPIAPAPPSPTPPSPTPPTPPSPTPPTPNVPPPPATEAPRHVEARGTESTGLGSVPVGATCSFDVTREALADGTFWCNAQVRCAGQLLYGGPSAGFFDCTLYEGAERHVVGEDANTTSVDRDSAMSLNTLTHTLVVRDDPTGNLGAFTVRAEVTSVR